MSEDFALEPVRKRPVLPQDRAGAEALLDTLKERHGDADGMARSSGLPWAHRMIGRRIRANDVETTMVSIDRAMKALRSVERHVDIVLPGAAAPKSLASAAPLLSELFQASGDHVCSSIAAQMAELDQERLLALVEDIRHLLHLEALISESVDRDLPRDEVVLSLKDAAGAAEALREEFDCESLDVAAERAAELEAQTSMLDRRVRRLTVLGARLDMPDITLEQIVRIADVCLKAKQMPREILSRLGEATPETLQAVEEAKAKAAKIVHAGNLLDGRIGTEWRRQPLDKLVNAKNLADIPGHPSHAKVGEYARSIGISSNVRVTLDAIVRTRSGSAAFDANPVLKRTMPRSFKGLQTDFDGVAHVVAARKELEDMLEGMDCVDKVVAAISSSHTVVADEFLAFSELRDEALAVAMDADTPLRRIRMLHDDTKRRLAALRLEIENMPVPEEQRTPADARRLGRLLRDLDGTRARIEASPERSATGAANDRDIARAHEWRERLFQILPEDARPHNDHAFAQLHVHARSGAQACDEAGSMLASLSGLLVPEVVPGQDLPFRESVEALGGLRAIEPVLHAQVLVCEAMDEILTGELGPFVNRMTVEGVQSKDWKSQLDEDYTLLASLEEEDAFASDLASAALAADADPVPVPEGDDVAVEATDAASPEAQWTTEEFDFTPIIALSIESTVEDEPQKEVAE